MKLINPPVAFAATSSAILYLTITIPEPPSPLITAGVTLSFLEPAPPPPVFCLPRTPSDVLAAADPPPPKPPA